MGLRTLPEAIESAAETTGGYSFLGENGAERFCSFGTLLERGRAVAGALAARGLKRGEIVVLIVPEAETFLESFIGVTLAGLVPAPIYPPAHVTQLSAYLQMATALVRASSASAIVSTAQLKRLLGKVQADAPDVRAVVAIEDLNGPPLLAASGVSATDPALLQFTSGSSSQPKGVVLSHANLAANIEALGGPHALAFGAEDIGVSWLPLFHDMGLIGMALSALYFGRRTAFLSPLMFLKRPVEWLRAITRYRGTVSFAPNFAYELCVTRVRDRELEGLDLTSWRVAGCGAEPIRAETLAKFTKKFAPVGFRETSLLPSYGMAEHVLAVTLSRPGRAPLVDVVRTADLTLTQEATPCPPDDPQGSTFVSCGCPLPGHQVKVVDEAGRALTDRQVGEILLSGPSVMQGYFRQEALTAQAIRHDWFWTGDLGYLLNGELYVCGRKKDLIIVNGRNYYPQDIEWAVSAVSGVRKGRIAAFSTLAPDHGERVIVVVETAGTREPTAIVEAVRRRVLEGIGLRVDEVVVAPRGTVGKTTSGKLQRNLVRSRYESGELLQPRAAARPAVIGHLARSQWGYLRVFVNRMRARLHELRHEGLS